jgi:hypothetical protein
MVHLVLYFRANDLHYKSGLKLFIISIEFQAPSQMSQKAPIGFVMSVCPSVLRNSASTGLMNEISYWKL